MGGNSSVLRIKSRSSSELDRIRPTAEQRTPRTRSKLASLAQSSSKQFSKLSFKRKGGSRDKTKSFRELISSWAITDLEALFRELNTSRAIGSLRDQADAARPYVPSLGEQLLASTSQNLTLVYKDMRFPVHKCLISSRCDNLRAQLGSGPQDSELQLSVNPDVDYSVDDLKAFIKYVYTSSWTGSPETLSSLRNWWGCYRNLSADLHEMERRGLADGDVTIVLTTRGPVGGEDMTNVVPPEFTIRCHSELVAGRSPLLRGSLAKGSSRIVLDEALLPRGFALLVVHFMYTDELDLTRVSDSAISQSSLSEARAIVSGRSPHSPLHRAIQIVHLAMFFSLHRLAQLCEDVMVTSLCADSCVSVLSWALDGGSPFVARQAQRYLESEFSKIALSHHLFDISLESMINCVDSQYIQATEVEILEAVIRWGEHEMLKRMEEREPNIVADTSHSISRRGVKRADLSGPELNSILAPLTNCIRTDYVLPPFHQSLNNAYHRGILERAPLRDLTCPSTSEINPDIHWFRPGQLATGPRFYQPYFETVKTQLIMSLEHGDVPRIPPSATSSSLRLEVRNLEPELLDENLFQEFESRLLESVESVDSEHQIRFFPRFYHRKIAVEMISLRILRELSIDPVSIEVSLVVGSPEGAEPILPATNQTLLPNHTSSQPSLHWPDIMTLERKKPSADEQKSGEYDPTPDEDEPCDL